MGIASGYFAKNLWFLVNFRLKISRTPFFCTTFVLSLHETSKMLRIKKLDIFVLKSFCMLFMGTFFICPLHLYDAVFYGGMWTKW